MKQNDLKEVCETYFSIIKDFRCECNNKHKLSDILIIIMCAVLSGIDEISKIEDYAKNKKDMLKDNFEILIIPSNCTISRVLNTIDPELVGIAILGILKRFCNKKIKLINIDGKIIRSTEKMSNYEKSLQILTAYSTEAGICIEQLPLYEKTNEIPVAQNMIDLLDIKNCIVTLDAMHCQKKTVDKICKKKGDYIIGLKGNQPNFFNDVDLMYKDVINSLYEEDKEKYEVLEIVEKNRDRCETRIAYNLKDISWCNYSVDWRNLRNIFAIRRIIEKKDKKTEEISYYITSLDCTLSKLMEYTRKHWAIESMHYILDVTYNEDKCRVLSENSQKALNIFRKMGLSIHKEYITRNDLKTNLKKNMFNCLLNDNLLIDVISNLTLPT